METNIVNNCYNYYQWRRQYLVGLLLIYEWHKKSLQKHRGKRRSMWVRDIFLKISEQGDYNNLLREMGLGDIPRYHNYMRMSPEQFDHLLSKMEHALAKNNNVRESISPGEILALTIRYLASGDTMISMSYSYRVGKSTVSNLVKETCKIIWNCLWQDYLKPPNREKWKKNSEDFKHVWQMPNCVGAIDGKHVVIQAPPNSGSDFYNYQGSHSIVLMSMCDPFYKFTLVDIGARGRQSDGGILRNSEMGKQLINNQLELPSDCPIEYGGEKLPFYIVGDEAFPLRTNLMRPYPGRLLSQDKRIFNYRLSRARRVSENTFGIWVARWRIFRRPINTCLETTEDIIKATICLYNYLMEGRHEIYCPTNFVDMEDANGNIINGFWREEAASNNVFSATRMGSNNATVNAAKVRSHLTSHFMFDGAVQFQWNK